MSFPQMLEVAIGLILIYYILGAFVSLITQIVMDSLETRGVALERYLKIIAGDMSIDLTRLPQIKALQPIRYTHWWNILGAGTAAKKLERIPVETLVDAFFDLSGLTARGSLNAPELTGLIRKLPDSEGRQALLAWIDQGVTAVSDLRSRTSAYFEGMLNQAALTFRAKARSFVIVASIVITVLFGTDTLQLAKELWRNAGLRSQVTQQAQIATSQPDGLADANTLLTDLGALSFRIGWWRARAAADASSASDWITYVASKLAGLAITAAAVSQGSSFWYDLLKKLTGSSAGAAKPDGDPPGALG
ncbi:MAG: hypothetical protein V1755_06260 [Chloroflexota bacterium]